MSTPALKRDPDRKELRSFGLLFGAMIALIFGLVLPWLFDHARPLWPWIALGVFALWAVALPATLKPVYRAWMAFGLFMSRITTPLLMGTVFFVVLTPMGLVRRLAARDALDRDLDPDATTYRKPSENLPPDRLDKPF